MTLSKRMEEGFWATIGLALPPEVKVMVSKEERLPGLFLDVMGHTAQVVPPDEPCHLIFVDLQPEANWAHECLYVYVVSDGSLFAVKHDWPPNEKHEMTPMGRPREGAPSIS